MIGSFSLLEATLKVLAASGEGVGERTAVLGPRRTTGAFLADPESLLRWCRTNERLVVKEELRDARVYAGFERLSRVRGVEPRYAEMRNVVDELWLIGENDYTPRLRGVRAYHVEAGPLLREWFLLVTASRYRSLLVARDIDGFDCDRPLAARRFEGVKTFRRDVIDSVEEMLRDLLTA